MIKAHVTFNRERWRWEVYESCPGKMKMQHHSFHRTETAARATANAQNKINKQEAANAAAK